MIIKGTVQGDAARMYRDFTYTKPIYQKLQSVWDVDPERLNYCDEYPRSVNPPKEDSYKTVELADYTVQISASDGIGTIDVCMQPNSYTYARVARQVGRMYASLAILNKDEVIDDFLKRVFSTPVCSLSATPPTETKAAE